MTGPNAGRVGADLLAAPLELACGAVLRNRIAKAAMSDVLGDGAGNATVKDSLVPAVGGGAALSLIGEVQVDPRYPERPGNLVLGPRLDRAQLTRFARAGALEGALIWPQLGHAGALASGAVADPAGPSALRIDGLTCGALPAAALEELPARYAAAARLARDVGFSGVEVHAGHGLLLSRLLSPLFDRRTDRYGGSIEARSQVLLDIVRRIRRDAGAGPAIALKINATDQLESGLTEEGALVIVEQLGGEAVDLIEISGGTYFPGSASNSDRPPTGPYYLDFARRAREVTDTPLMLTGGFKTRQQAEHTVTCRSPGLRRSTGCGPRC